MIHDSTWLGRTRARRRARMAAPLVFVLGCVLLTLAGFASVALASGPEMRGEWEIVLKAGGQTNTGTTVIRQEAGAKGEFASEAVQFTQGSPGTFEGTLEGSSAKVKITTSAAGSLPPSQFESETMTVTSGAGTLEISGEGTFTVPALNLKATGTVVAKRIKAHKEVEEREARELKEREEKKAREAIRGEWALTVEYGQTAKGIALVTEEANAKNEFASSSSLFESVVPGSFSGTLEGKEASLTIATEAAGPYPATTFTGAKIAVTLTGSSMSMTGAGTLSVGGNSIPATVTATRVKTYAEVLARERAEAEAKEKQEREVQEAKEKTEREAKEKTELEAKEKREREAREAVEKANKLPNKVPPPLQLVTPPAPMPVVVATRDAHGAQQRRSRAQAHQSKRVDGHRAAEGHIHGQARKRQTPRSRQEQDDRAWRGLLLACRRRRGDGEDRPLAQRAQRAGSPENAARARRAHHRNGRQTGRCGHLQADPVRSGAQERLRQSQEPGQS